MAGDPSGAPVGSRAPGADDHEILLRIFEDAPDAILLVDRAGRILRANAQTAKMFGYPHGALTGQPVELLIPERFARHHVAHREGYIAAPRPRPMGAGLTLAGRRQDGSEFPVDIMLSPLGDSSALVLGIVRDATERKRVEALALEAREMYFKEVHHRVKNNLQVISSLLFLQSRNTSDPGALAILTESRSRVQSIALIHEKLYRSAELTTVDFGEYVRDLVAELIATYGVGHENLRVRTEAAALALDIDTAVPCGLIINELVSNVLKHAFPDGRDGEVAVTVGATGNGRYRLEVRDTGAGLPAGLDWRHASTLGLRLVTDLASQLDGELTITSSPQGTDVRLVFAPVTYKERR
ncbi:MAG: sensor histidine kinase [Vicinamibacterales bacterium]